jgi:hypothetical protein
MKGDKTLVLEPPPTLEKNVDFLYDAVKVSWLKCHEDNMKWKDNER